MPSLAHLAIEANIGRAHRYIARARDLSSDLADLGLHDDLQLFLIELERLQVDLLRGTKRPRKLSS